MRCGCSTKTGLVGFAFIESYRPDDPGGAFLAGSPAPTCRRVRGAGPYGHRRCSWRRRDAAAYPRGSNSGGFGFFDLRGELAVTTPLPLSPRHTLTLDARARDLPGSPTGDRMLRVGGYVLQPLARQSDRPERTAAATNPFLPPGVLFAEPLRGFEDHRSTSTASASAARATGCRHRPRLASPRGRRPPRSQQLDFWLFAVAATTAARVPAPAHRRGRLAVAAPGVWLLLITIQYQTGAASPTIRRWCI